MKKYLLLFSICTLLFATSCLTIKETYQFTKNEEGFMEYVVDIKNMASILQLAEGEAGIPSIDDISFKDVGKRLNSIPGVSMVNVINDQENFEYGVSFKFKHLEALNNALNQIMVLENNVSKPHTFFKMEDGILVRDHLMNRSFNTKELLGDDEASEYALSMLQSMKYQVNFSFKRPVKVVYTASDAKLEGKKNQSISLQADFKVLTEDHESLDASIVFK